jgi:hypothetical protein
MVIVPQKNEMALTGGSIRARQEKLRFVRKIVMEQETVRNSALGPLQSKILEPHVQKKCRDFLYRYIS